MISKTYARTVPGQFLALPKYVRVFKHPLTFNSGGSPDSSSLNNSSYLTCDTPVLVLANGVKATPAAAWSMILYVNNNVASYSWVHNDHLQALT